MHEFPCSRTKSTNLIILVGFGQVIKRLRSYPHLDTLNLDRSFMGPAAGKGT